jgi:ankyrin repeat protein
MQRPPDFDEYQWGRETWPFFAAVRSGDRARVMEMLGEFPWLARAEYAYLQCLHFVVLSGHPERLAMAELLLSAGANPAAEGWSGRFGPEKRDDSPLARARDREERALVELLEEAASRLPGDVPEQPRDPPSARRELEDEMMQAAHRGDRDAALALIGRHPGIAQAGLYEAVHQDHPALVRLLISHGADVTIPWRWCCWYTYLMHSLRYPRPRYGTAELLLAHGLSPNETNGQGMTTLHILAGQGTTESVRWLIDRGADLHARDAQFASTPLAWAARAGRADMVDLLLERGARAVDPEDAPWATPVAWARRRGHGELAEKLLAAGTGS